MDIDVLPDREYNESHIPGAISLPLRHLTSETVSVRRRDKPVVVYWHWPTASARCGRTSVSAMVEEMVPVFRVDDGEATASWYERLGFQVVGRHRFAPELPLYLFLERNHVQLHLSEHEGDATPNSLVYFYVEDVDSIAREFGVTVKEEPWAREIALVDPDGNRLRIGQPTNE